MVNLRQFPCNWKSKTESLSQESMRHREKASHIHKPNYLNIIYLRSKQDMQKLKIGDLCVINLVNFSVGGIPLDCSIFSHLVFASDSYVNTLGGHQNKSN